ncbi:alpha-L-fucosidase [Amycolatopsis suaedae]|uniref:alpha-L-fucosidase n=1 Tax=Amycolatopsis suaedae TaxID=2510978 RepID=A0A4Q7JAE4_9PSEU|nr:alpha-L-fucosidase [Amycolatopsis suaedae]RZQ63443.1 alpha-L-fucosidase [Amycolatopsis suaedae]
MSWQTWRTALISAAATALVVGLLTDTGQPTHPTTVAQASPPASGPGTNHAIDDPLTSERTRAWREDRFGMFIHFGVYSHLEGEYTRPDGTVCRDAEWIKRQCRIPQAEYERFAAEFNPAEFDAEAIARTAKEAGQRYIVITSKHHDGYALWPTKVNRWNLRDHSSFDKNRDILAELKAATERHGIKLGFYYSIWDWNDPDAVHPSTFGRYKERMYAQLKELVDNYQPSVFWFDGEWSTDRPSNPWLTQDGEALEAYVRTLDPKIVVNNRVGKRRLVDGDTGTPEQTIPAEPVSGQLWESCMTLNGSWGYAKWDNRWKSPADLTRNLISIAGRGGNYLLNVGPDARGRIPAESVDRLRAMGSWLVRNRQADAVHGAGTPGIVAEPDWGSVSRKGDTLYASVYRWPGAGGSLTLKALSGFDVRSARVLGSTQRVAVSRSGDTVTLTPSGAPTNDIATVIAIGVAPPAPAAIGTGTGLKAEFWANRKPGGTPTVTRTDPLVNYNWKYQGSPDPTILYSGFSGRWTGFVQPRFSERYTLTTLTSNTVRLWVDDKLVVDNWQDHGPLLSSVAVDLQAGKRHKIRLDFRKESNEAVAKLLWSSPNTPEQVIPTTQLYPA